MIVDRLAEECGFTFKNRGCESDYAEYRNQTDKFIVAKPRTYMNESGKAVKSLMKKFNIDIHDVVVICDDIDQEPGKVRLRKSGSAGTHNGLKSIIAETGSQEFNRLRVGIGRQAQHQDLANFVLSKMHMSDEQKQGLGKALDAVCGWVEGESLESLMGSFNGDSTKNGKH
jgi:PTH1 family peptidyl-tRNA hydrolase